MRIFIEAHGFEYVEEHIVASAGRAKFLIPALNEVADDMIESTKIEFQSQGRRFGGSWAMYTKPWERQKVKKEYDLRIMYATHRLIDSLTDKDNPEMVLEVTNKGIRYGSSVPYADTHQHGNPARNIPARPFISFQGGDLDRWSKIIAAYIVDPMKEGGRAHG